ncbi:hypothetical protein R1sor_011439 [Riccia sorocarpa]|uniref:Uncharacterized protein n=1 Tax=Riccia sorocarpa TaxID=122646 RepID=A0ABD3I0X0_9MARC
MGSQSKRQSTVDRRRTDQLGQSSRRIARANEDRLRLRRQRYAEQQAERRAASSSELVASGSQRGIRRKVMEIVDKLKSLSSESVERGTNSIQEQYQLFFRGQVPFRAWWQEYDVEFLLLRARETHEQILMAISEVEAPMFERL